MSRPASRPRSLSDGMCRLATEALLSALAERQHGVVSLAQLGDLGLGPRGAQHRAAGGRLHRIHRGVYAIAPRALLKREGHWMAAVLAGGPGVVLSHRSAAALHHLRDWGAARTEVTQPADARRRLPGVHVHRSRTLLDRDTTTIDEIPVTTVARTLLDLGDVLPRRELERACDKAEALQLFDLTAVLDQLQRNANRPGAAVLRAILEEHHIGQTPTASEIEEAMLAVSRAVGLPDPHCNYLIDPHDGERAIRVDFAWPEQRLAVEGDSKQFHLTPMAFERDRRRDQRLLVAGWRVIRTTWNQLTRRPREIQRTLIALLQAG